jgi:aminoglycoside phosphotransferase family enzyme/predicted kinase
VKLDLARLIDALSRPEAFPFAVDRVEVRQTHISVVFLAGDRAFKIKKPVRLGFLDYGTLLRRRRLCAAEVRLNRPRAPDVYLGVVPIVRGPAGPRFGGRGRAMEYAVAMRRLPDAARLSERIGSAPGSGRALLERLGRRLASLHRDAPRSRRIASRARYAGVARNVRDNFAAAATLAAGTISRRVLERLTAQGERELGRLRPLIDARAAGGRPCDCHGDLRLEHVYHFPERRPPGDLVIIDGIEFNERFRFIDPVSDMAFLHMDLIVQGRRDLAAAFARAYFRASGDRRGKALLPFYTSYRAAVRGKVQGLKAQEAEVEASERERARRRARAFWLLALGAIEPPERRPCLLLLAGLPGTGKTTLAGALAAAGRFEVIRTDVIRKEGAPDIAARPRRRGAAVGFERGLYAADRTRAVYAETLRRAEAALFEGGRVVVDASFRDETRRLEFRRAALAWGVPCAILHCTAPAGVVRRRLAARRADASDADWTVYREMARRFEPFGDATRDTVREIDTSGTKGAALRRGLAALRSLGVLG